MRDFPRVVARALAAQGAAVEWIDSGCLAVVAPEPVRRALDLPEWALLGFGPEPPEGTVRLGLDSDWAERMEALLGERGRCLVASFPRQASALSTPPLQPILERELVFDNATFRLVETFEDRTSYAVLFFRVTAVSDEKRRELVALCVNESNGCLAEALTDPLLAALERGDLYCGEEVAEGALGKDRLRSLSASLLPTKIRSHFASFLAAMERRMARDLDRLHAYYADLRAEAAARLEHRRRGEPEELARKEELRLQAAAREYEAKLTDLQRKYALNIEVEFVAALRAQVPVWRMRVDLLRRKGRTGIHLDWNPVSRTLDRVLCDRCAAPARVFSLCDDRLHRLCPSCGTPCPACGRPGCPACAPARCARCGANRLPA